MVAVLILGLLMNVIALPLAARRVVFLYRVIHEGADVRESMAKLNSVWAPDPVWKRFIEETLAANGKKAEIL